MSLCSKRQLEMRFGKSKGKTMTKKGHRETALKLPGTRKIRAKADSELNMRKPAERLEWYRRAKKSYQRLKARALEDNKRRPDIYDANHIIQIHDAEKDIKKALKDHIGDSKSHRNLRRKARRVIGKAVKVAKFIRGRSLVRSHRRSKPKK